MKEVKNNKFIQGGSYERTIRNDTRKKNMGTKI